MCLASWAQAVLSSYGHSVVGAAVHGFHCGTVFHCVHTPQLIIHLLLEPPPRPCQVTSTAATDTCPGARVHSSVRYAHTCQVYTQAGKRSTAVGNARWFFKLVLPISSPTSSVRKLAGSGFLMLAIGAGSNGIHYSFNLHLLDD